MQCLGERIIYVSYKLKIHQDVHNPGLLYTSYMTWYSNLFKEDGEVKILVSLS